MRVSHVTEEKRRGRRKLLEGKQIYETNRRARMRESMDVEFQNGLVCMYEALARNHAIKPFSHYYGNLVSRAS